MGKKTLQDSQLSEKIIKEEQNEEIKCLKKNGEPEPEPENDLI